MKSSRVTTFALSVLLLLAAGCTGGSDDSDSGADTASGEAACDTPPFTTPPDVDAASCRWLTAAEDVVGFHDTIVASVEESPGQYRMRALDPATGDLLWQTDPLGVISDDPDSSEPNDMDRSLEIVHWMGKPYASFEYVTQPEGLAEPRDAVTFVSLADGGPWPPVTWVSPSEQTVVHTEHIQSDGVTLAMTEAESTYQVIDPTTGRTTPPLKTDSFEVLQAVGDGWLAESSEAWGWDFVVRDYGGAVRWNARDHVPEGADPDGYRDVVGAYGEYVVAIWDKPGPFSTDGPWLLVVHDKDGNVVAQADYGTSDSTSQNRVVVSPNEQWMVVDSNYAGSRPVAVNLAERTATSLPAPLAPLSVTDAGVVYAVDWGNSKKRVSVDGNTGKTLWTGPVTSRIPSTVVGDVAMVSESGPVALVGGQVEDDGSDTQPSTARTWALAADSAPVPGPTEEPAPDIAAQAAQFAPLVYLAEGERNRPANASTVVQRSKLMWDLDKPCGDDVVAQDVDEATLAAGGYERRAGGCRSEETERAFRTNEDTAPNHSEDVPDRQGFYLDLDDGYRGGEPLDSDGRVPAPMYWEYVPGEAGSGEAAYIYWLFYAYNDYLNNHEGDWERVAVQVKDDQPVGVTFWKHNEPACMVPWTSLDNWEGHPITYSAKGSHGSYPDVGLHGHPGGTDTTSQGDEWQTWEHAQSITEQPWWGYAGAWGWQNPVNRSLLKEFSGPDGPNPVYDKGAARANALTDQYCGKPANIFHGTWVSDGPVAQPSSTTTYHARLTIGEMQYGSVGLAVYPGLGCTARLEYVRETADMLVLREVVSRDPKGTCLSGVRVVLRPTGEGLSYAAQGPPGSLDVTATADLILEAPRRRR